MADTTEKIIFEVDASSWEKSLANISSDIDALKETQKSLLEQARAGSAQAAIEYEKVSAALKVQQQQYRTTQAVVVGYYQAQLKGADANNFANNSIEQNRSLLKQLTAQYIQTVKPTQEFTDKIKKLSDTLKEQEGAIGDTRRNVGNYAGAFSSAFDLLKNAGGPLGAAAKGFDALGASVAAGTGGITLLIPLLFSLFDLFKGNAEVADQLTFALDGVTKVFSVLIDDAVEIGKELFDIFSNPKKAIEDLVTAIKDNLVNRFKALGVIVDAIAKKDMKALTDGLIQLGTGVTNASDKLNNAGQAVVNYGNKLANAAKEGYNASAALDELITTNAKLNAEIKRGQAQADALTKSLKDRTKTEQERIKIANQIADIEIETANKIAVVRQKELDAIKLKLKDRKLSAEQEAEIIEKQSEVEQAALDARTAAAQRQTRINILLDKQNTQAKDTYYQELERLQTEFLLTEREKLAKSFDDKLKQIKGNSEVETTLRLAIENERENALINFDRAAQEKRDKIAKDKEAKRLAELSKTFNEAVQLNQAIADNEIAKIDLTTATLEEKEKAKQKILLDSLKKQLQLTEAYFGEDGVITDIEKASLERLRILIQKTTADINKETGGGGTLGALLGVSDTEIKKAKDGLSNAEQITNSIGGLVSSLYAGQIQDIENKKNAEIEAIEASGASEEEKDKRRQEAEKRAALDAYEVQKSQFEVNKAISIVQTIINTAAAIVAQLTNPTPYVGIALSALAAATGAAQIGVIASQQPPPPPRFAEGVIGLDGAGTETSDSIPAYLSKGESVVTAKATRRFHRELAEMELAVGNQPNYQFGKGKFATGIIGVPNVVTGDGGFSSRDIANTIQQTQLLASINTSLQNMPTPVVSVKEITKVTNKRNQSVSVSEL